MLLFQWIKPSIFLIISVTFISFPSNAIVCKKVSFGGVKQLFCPHNKHFYKLIQENKGDEYELLGQNKDSSEYICKKVMINNRFQVFCPHSNSFYDPIYIQEYFEEARSDLSRSKIKEIDFNNNHDEYNRTNSYSK